MDRQALTDGSGRWFDFNKVTIFDEATFWDGHNHRSRATGSPHDHERLLRTASGRWIIEHTSAWQGSYDQYREISDKKAAQWLVINEHEPHDACATEYAALEIQ